MMYRFRPIESLLGKYKELENQEIYFASPEELNDPMEGLRDVFWQGDEIVWRNLFINYAKSLQRIFALTVILNESKEITESDIKVSWGLFNFNSVQDEKLNREIIQVLFSNKFINNLILSFPKRKKPIRRSELLSYLQIIHPFVLNSISHIFLKNGLIDKLIFHQNLDRFENAMKKSGSLPELTNKLEEEANPKLSTALFDFFNHYAQSNALKAQLSFSDVEIKTNAFFLISEFPNKFISKLENEIYPDWYSASFLRNNKNSALWGHYGNNHQGVCLKYKTTNEGEKLTLNLETEYGYSSAGPTIGMRPHSFKKVEYHNEHVSIDFFRSLGRLSKNQLKALWYKNDNLSLSVCGSHLESKQEEDKWRKNYWDNFNKSLVIKLKEWEYEDEYRLVVHGDLTDYSKKEKRKLKYDFKDLESITFGIKTPNSSKLEIIKIINNKCKAINRKDFEFYQAYYSKGSGQIESFKLNL
ncbi:hypothetical protein GCM10011531_07060 [Aquaticitalea lipolytica]|uniref:DUF2971 domain-containing protein n=1 Tax=Aquaticitalea lipolytica TaxID=1247562 RepID=A0A8J2TPH1_9FLAO|nr:DUF2971 domain-containing protein [Aquaticitalea lipolytica]GFZ79737.1 hypothetical protein GCM10011531_07060 [Aquaticitalea lipolytica]